MKADRYALPAAGRAALGGRALRQAEPADPGLVRGRHRRAGRASDHRGHPDHPLRPGRDAGRRRPGAVPLRQRDRHADLRRRPARRGGGRRHRAGGQRAHRRLPPVPGPGRPADRAGARWAARPGARSPTSATRANNMAHSYLLGGATAGMHVRVAGPAGASARPGHRGGGRPRSPRGTGGSVAVARRPGRRPCRRGRRASPPTPGPRWARRATGWTGTRRSCRTRSTPRCWPRPSRTRSCCTACRPTAARRSPTR